MGVPKPPKFAATGIDKVNAIRPLPFAGSAANTGARKVSINAAVAVLEINIENNPVISRKPSKTFSLFFPNGRIRFRANKVSSPDLDAAIAMMKPARKSIMIGSANEAIISVESSNFPTLSPLNTPKAFFDTVTHIIAVRASDVAQAGIHSVSQERIAKTKIAITRC